MNTEQLPEDIQVKIKEAANIYATFQRNDKIK